MRDEKNKNNEIKSSKSEHPDYLKKLSNKINTIVSVNKVKVEDFHLFKSLLDDFDKLLKLIRRLK